MEPAAAPPETGPPDESVPHVEAAPARAGRIVLAAVLTEIVVIAAIGNQWVTTKLFHSIEHDGHQFSRDFKASLAVYNWRFAPQASDHQHILLSQFLLILITVALSAALIGAIVRGPGTYGRVFLVCWLSVVFATMVGAYVRGYTNRVFGTTGSRAARAVFGALGPNAFTFLAALLLGVFAGLAGATVAVLTRQEQVAVADADAGERTQSGEDLESDAGLA